LEEVEVEVGEGEEVGELVFHHPYIILLIIILN
jgi:hypothetical protein